MRTWTHRSVPCYGCTRVAPGWRSLRYCAAFKGTAKPLLVFLNKVDGETGLVTPAHISKMIGADALKAVRPVSVVQCSALSGAGVAAGFGWLAAQV